LLEIDGGGSLFVDVFFWCLIRVRVKDGGGKAEMSQGNLGAGGARKGRFHIPGGMVVRGERRQSICQLAFHMSQRSIFSSSEGL